MAVAHASLPTRPNAGRLGAPGLDPLTLSGAWGRVWRGSRVSGCGRWDGSVIAGNSRVASSPSTNPLLFLTVHGPTVRGEVFWVGSPRAVACSQAIIAASGVAYTLRLGPSDPWH